MSATPVLGGRYRLIDRLGQGGMSVVWRGHDDVLDRPVAVKVLAAQEGATPHARERVLAEARAAARLSHPHINQVHDYGESADDAGNLAPYIVMELLTGQTLAARLRHGPLPPRAAARICGQVASALAAAHQQGLVHRDVKPGNIMLTPAGPKVVDFGIAAAAGQPAGSTSEGDVWGTPAYVAPERLTDGLVLPASDVYGLGLVLYRALTGEPPWPARTVPELLAAHISGEPARLPPVAGLPAGVAELCHRCLAKDPGHRPDAAELASQLAAAAGDQAGDRAEELAGSRSGTALAAAPPPDPVPARHVPAVRALPAPAAPGADPPVLAGESGPPTVDIPPRPPGRRRRIAVALASVTALFAGLLAGLWLLGDRPDFSGGAGDMASLSQSPTATARATGSAPPSPGRATASPPPGPVEHAVETPLGTLVVECDGATARLVSSDLLPGVDLFEVDPDAAPELTVELTALRQEIQVSVECEAGQPAAAVSIG